jgi:nitrite reductase/ring-hydroxylating ferredoxin subunit
MNYLGSDDWLVLGEIHEIPPGHVKRWVDNEHPVAVANVDGRLYALDDRCPHLGCSLARGHVDQTIISCPCHGSRFEMTNGRVLSGPSRRGVDVFAIRQRGDLIELETSGQLERRDDSGRASDDAAVSEDVSLLASRQMS